MVTTWSYKLLPSKERVDHGQRGRERGGALGGGALGGDISRGKMDANVESHGGRWRGVDG